VSGEDGARPGIPAPDLIGLELATAIDVAAAQGLALNAVSLEGAVGRAHVVVGQSPSPGVRMGSLWRIHVLVREARPVSAHVGPGDG
jgi:hypothetical protein